MCDRHFAGQISLPSLINTVITYWGNNNPHVYSSYSVQRTFPYVISLTQQVTPFSVRVSRMGKRICETKTACSHLRLFFINRRSVKASKDRVWGSWTGKRERQAKVRFETKSGSSLTPNGSSGIEITLQSLSPPETQGLSSPIPADTLTNRQFTGIWGWGTSVPGTAAVCT